MKPLLVLLLTLVFSQFARADLRSDLEEIRSFSTIPVLAYALVKDGNIVESVVLGDSVQDPRFRAGSVSKTVTTLLIMSLVEDGTLALDDPVSKYLGEDAPRNKWKDVSPLRILHLLEQTSGMPGTSYADYKHYTQDISPSAILKSRDLVARWQPGKFFSYANINHTIAAAVAEKATGISFDSLVHDRVLQPLEMVDASFRSDKMASGTLLDSVDASGKTSNRWDLDVRPSGALIASIDDLAKLARFLATDGAIIDANWTKSLLRMRKPEASLVAKSGYEFTYGAGLFSFFAAGDLFYGHWGRIDGFQTTVGVKSGLGDGFALIANGEDRRAFNAARERIALEIAVPSVQPPTIRDQDLSEYTGWWYPFTEDNVKRAWLMGLAGFVRISEVGSDLLQKSALFPSEGILLTPVKQGQFRVGGYPVATHVFARDDQRELFLFGDQQQSFKKLGFLQGYIVVVTFWLSIVAIFMSSTFCALAVLRTMLGKPRGTMTLPWIALGAGGLTLLLLQILHIKWGLFGLMSDTTVLAEISLHSAVLFLLSVSWPVLAALSVWIFLRVDWRSTSVLHRATYLLFVSAFVNVFIFLALNSWVPLMTWL